MYTCYTNILKTYNYFNIQFNVLNTFYHLHIRLLDYQLHTGIKYRSRIDILCIKTNKNYKELYWLQNLIIGNIKLQQMVITRKRSLTYNSRLDRCTHEIWIFLCLLAIIYEFMNVCYATSCYINNNYILLQSRGKDRFRITSGAENSIKYNLMIKYCNDYVWNLHVINAHCADNLWIHFYWKILDCAMLFIAEFKKSYLCKYTLIPKGNRRI